MFNKLKATALDEAILELESLWNEYDVKAYVQKECGEDNTLIFCLQKHQ